jgi:hypothetical protein
MLNSVSVSNNLSYGANLINSGAMGKSVTLIDSTFSDNGDYGLTVSSKGAIVLNGTSASTNTGSGAVLNNSNATVPVTINSTATNAYNSFNSNGGYGLQIVSLGVIMLNNVNASGNTQDGLNLDNQGSTAIVTISDKNSNPASTFSKNSGNGVYVHGKGNILITGVAASGNGLAGFDLDNCLASSGTCTGSGLITLLTVTASSNGSNGISAVTKGNLSVTGSTTSSNGNYGLYLNNKYLLGNVTLKNIVADSNNNTGISISTNGLVTLGALEADYNAKTSGTLSDGDSVLDFYYVSNGEKRWNFSATAGTTYTILLQQYSGNV